MSATAHTPAAASHDGGNRLAPSSTVARVTLRPIASPLPLGAFALVPAGLLLSGMQLGWFAQSDARTVAFMILGFAVPLQLTASVFAFLGRDALVGTGFGLFTGIWLAFALTQISGSVGPTSKVLGVFFLACAALFVMMAGGGILGGKAAAGAVVIAGAARFLLSGLYELTESTGVEHAAGIVGLVFVAVALYVGTAALLEDSAHRTVLPIGRRGRARDALEGDLPAQLNVLEHEAGVRDQL
jgi:succinate-acetate transporter protein